MPRDIVNEQLTDRYSHVLDPARQRRLQQRWASYPALANKTASTITSIITDGYHIEHNAVAAALLDAHHHDNDDDASTLLLTALRPIVMLLDPHQANEDVRITVWHEVARCIATSTGDEVRASSTPFFVTTYGRLRGKVNRSTLQRDRMRRQTPKIHALRPEEYELPNPRDLDDPVAVQALARIQVDRLADDHAFDRLLLWSEQGITSGIHQEWVARARRRLTKAVGYAA